LAYVIGFKSMPTTAEPEAAESYGRRPSSRESDEQRASKEEASHG